MPDSANHGSLESAFSGSTPIYGAGEMAERIRVFPWETTPLGPITIWPVEFITVVNQMLCSPLPGFLYGGPELICLYNDAFLPVLAGKHPASLGQVASESWVEVWDIIGGPIRQTFATGEVFNFESIYLEIVRFGRSDQWYWTFSYTPIRDIRGNILGVLGVVQELTAAVEAEAKLRASEARANRILSSIGDAVIVTDSVGNVDSMNAVAEALTHWPQAEAKGKPLVNVFRIVNEGTRRPVENPVEKVRRLNAVVGLANHTILIGRNGEETHIDDSAAPIRNDKGEITGIVLVFRNVEERRTLEKQGEKSFQQLQMTLTKLQLAMEFARQGSFFYDQKTGLVTVDAVTQELFELPSDSGPAEYWISKVHPDDQQRVAETFASAASGKALYILEHRIVRSDGVRWLDARAKVLSEPGEPMVFTGVCEDITVRKQTEAAMMQNEKLAAVGRLASTIAHEINNPLEAVTNLLYLARHSEDIAEAIPYLETADGELRRASTITNQALRFHRQSTRPTASTFEHLIEGMFTGRHTRLQNAHATELLRDRTTRPVLCFEGEIRQVLSNLVGNAIDALQSTGGKLFVRARDGHDWSTGRAGMVLTVADTGAGIPEAIKTKLFDAFFTTKGAGGSGLGLWISKDIVERHAGKMRLRSSQGLAHHGTVFTIFLPYEAVMREFSGPQ